VADRRRRDRDFPWNEVLIVGVIAMLTAGFIGGGVGWVVRGGGTSASPARSSTSAASSQPSGPVAPAVAAGAHDFVQFGCGQCHGMNGSGGVSPYVPTLNTLGTSLTAAQLSSTIEHGAGVSANPTRPYMPIWHGIVSKQQINDLVAYIHAGLPAVTGATAPVVPTDQGLAVEGATLYVRDGCINCHGPNGLGGVPNPASPDKTIPPLSGAAFRSQFDTPKKIKDVILSGSVLGHAPIVSMPHWGGILTPAQLNALVAYLSTLT
jgi:mono/diheme cytochrome c family protein